MGKFTEFKYNRQNYRSAFEAWMHVVNEWVEDDAAQRFVAHIGKNYGIKSSAVSQHLKRTILNTFNFNTGQFVVSFKFFLGLIPIVQYVGALFYFLFFSSWKRADKQKSYKLIIDDIDEENLDYHKTLFGKIIQSGDVLCVTQCCKTPIISGVAICNLPKFKGYDSYFVLRAIGCELVHGFFLLLVLSWRTRIDFFRLAISVLHNYLYYSTVFSRVIAPYNICSRDYSSSAIKRALFHSYGGGQVCAVQRSRHGYTALAAFMSWDIYFPLGAYFGELSRALKGNIEAVVPVGSLVCERRFPYHEYEKCEKKFDVLYLDSILHKPVDLYDAYRNDHLETYRWLVRFAREHKKFSIGFKKDDRYSLCSEAEEILSDTAIMIISNADSYAVSMCAKVITTYHSTMGFELLGEQVPVVFCDPGSRCYYFFAMQEINVGIGKTYEEFQKKLLLLLQDEECRNQYAQEFGHLCCSSQYASKKILETVQ